jgi:hypothetical protein
LPVAALVYHDGIFDASVFHGFHKCGALAPRSRSINQNAQIAAKERAKIPPHARKVDVKLVVMTSSVLLCYPYQRIEKSLMKRIIIKER